LNYIDHREESGFEKPQRPLLFSKTPNALTGPFDPILLPRSSDQIDWEAELAVVIGKAGKRIEANKALDYVAGFSVINDVSGRQAQFSDGQWFRGKSFDTFAPMGPALVTVDEIENLQNLKVTARVNGKIMQDGNSADMLFDIPTIIAFISQDITLWPGDIISTGTPSGVGIFREPPVLLKAGDVVECEVESVGTIRNSVKLS
jgi:2-keto-4-pentenoate hydratase/2-oxohepta-3-ene-1,7-dioic acid hydratase in catechol pathway